MKDPVVIKAKRNVTSSHGIGFGKERVCRTRDYGSHEAFSLREILFRVYDGMRLRNTQKSIPHGCTQSWGMLEGGRVIQRFGWP